MKTKLSLLTLFACAAGTMLSAEAIEGYPVIIYDTSDSPIALATSLNDVATYINGADGDKAEIYADDTITSTITFDRDTYWQLVSDSDAVRTISGNTTLFDVSSGSMRLILDSIVFSGAIGKVFYSSGGGNITLGGNAEFKNNSGYVISGNSIFLENSEMTFSGNTGTYVFYGDVQIGSGSTFVFSQNKSCIYGDLTAGDNVSVSFSGNTGTGIYGNVALGNNAIFSASGNSSLVIDGTTISFGEKSQL
ncbi:MAG: hypothetical protein IJX22_05920, partial [Opitutales bacterium]|nr:hypothetical protein [Opitutales bacterium]